MTISVITPTCDRPIPFALCERWMSRQTVQPDEWIVADGHVHWADCSMRQVHLRTMDNQPPGPANFANNLLNGIAAATGDVIIIVEDDDWYSPIYIETMVALLEPSGTVLAGCYPQHYYHVGQRLWRTMPNLEHSSLCQTAMRASVLPLFESIVRKCLARREFHIDFTLWGAIPRAQWSRVEDMTCVGIKGLPGQPGLGIGHRPTGKAWTRDPDLAKLREWIGADADLYAALA